MKKILTTGIAAMALGAFALDPGGVSVDLSVLKGGADVGSDAVNLFKCGDFEGENVLNTKTAPWSGGSYVWSKGLKDQAHRQRIISKHQRFIDPKEGVNCSACAVILTPERHLAPSWLVSSL